MIKPLLTIAIPTFDRAPHLELLLTTLTTELDGLNNKVELIISDNASSDRTPDVCKNFSINMPSASMVRNVINIGAENNFIECLSRAHGRYFWIIGDDDLPKSGVIKMIIQLLEKNNPDLIYLESEWFQILTSADQGSEIKELHAVQMSAEDLAVKINVWLTFVSALIINRNLFFENYSLLDAGRYRGTNLIQLGWIFGVLKKGSKFIYVRNRCMLATADNSGGYEIIKTFGIYFPKIVHEIFAENTYIARNIIRQCLITHTPGIIWQFRFKSNPKYKPEAPWPLLRKTLGSFPEYWAILYPISHFPKIISRLFLHLSFFITYIIKWSRFLGCSKYIDSSTK